MKVTSGTKEWADSNVNIAYGCSHDCQYCYAKKLAIFSGRKTRENWKEMVINRKAVEKGYRKRKGRVMFPSSHDITPEILGECLIVLKKLLFAGNTVLITTKPHISCVKEICQSLSHYFNQIQFRFTITSKNNKLLEKYEPGAPRYEERLMCLSYAYGKGIKTSVSIEPFLDYDPIPLIEEIEPYVTESIWIGPLNHYKFPDLIENYRGFHLYEIYRKLRNMKKIRFKDAFIKKMGVRPNVNM